MFGLMIFLQGNASFCSLGGESRQYSLRVLEYSSEEYSSILRGILQYSQGILACSG